jgi:acetyl/propionyl-CoA carboxylase alpha subunit
MMPIKRILIANRGVIARRIARTCRLMGIPTVIAYTARDSDNAWISGADECIEIPDLPNSCGYLNGPALVAAGQKLGAAIHPGYGFLSERSDFKQLCDHKNIQLIGPSTEVLNLAGHKSQCQIFLRRAGFPLIPSLTYPETSGLDLSRACAEMGYPLIVKPARGGGGQGMFMIDSAEVLASGLEQAHHYALQHFGDPALLIEKYLKGARHIEVQLVADSQGTCIHLFERECSLQRRRQKVIEEAPVGFLSHEQRQEVWQLALDIGQTIGLNQVGTIEFLFHQNSFYFLEINPRIQVEHAVTEEITGEDLIAWQIQIAQGTGISELKNISQTGHSIEARIYAENPQTGLPSAGQIDYLHWPDGPGVRIESGIQIGHTVTVDFDPLLIKLICHGKTREIARLRLIHALRELVLIGSIEINTPALLAMLEQPDFISADYHTQTYSQLLTSKYSKADLPEFINDSLPLNQPYSSPSQPSKASFQSKAVSTFWQAAYIK